MSLEMGEFSVQSKGGIFIGGCGLFARFKQSQIMNFFMSLDKCSPSIAIFALVNAFYPALVGFADALVMQIFSVCCLSKFFPLKTMRFSVAMIDLIRRKFSSYNQPYYSMRQVHRSIDTNSPISISALTSSQSSFLGTRGTTYFPAKFSRSFVVAQQCSDVFGRQIGIGGFAHVVSLGGIGS